MSATVERKTMQSPWRGRWAVILVAWVAVVLIAISSTWFESRFYETPPPLGPALAWSALRWLFWLVAAPVVLWAAERWPIRRERLWLGVSIHLALALATIFLRALWTVTLSLWLRPFPGMSEMTFSQGLTYFLFFNFLPELAIYGAILGGGLAHMAVREARAKERTASRLAVQLGEAKLSALRAQIQPHFFFNSLNTVSMMVRSDDREGAVRVIADLGDLLRYALASGSRQWSTVAEEVDFARRYLEVERARFPDRLAVEIEVPGDLAHLEVPSLVLQPLVENAARHGVGRSKGPARVRVSARRVDAGLELAVTDDGAGLAPDFDLERDAGLGLDNTRDRLAELYGDAARLTLARREEGGTRATVVVPIDEKAARERGKRRERREHPP